jgi:hypothetical protein
VGTIRDRVAQAALKLVLEPIFEADFLPCSYEFRPNRRAHRPDLALGRPWASVITLAHTRLRALPVP